MPQSFGTIFYHFHSTYRPYFCPNLAFTPKSLNTKIENFSPTSSPSGVPYKVFKLLLNAHIQTDVQMQMNAFLHPAPDPEHSLTPKTVQ